MKLSQDKKKYTVFEGLEHGNRFFSMTNYEDPHPEQLYDGTVAYRILGYCDTVRQAQTFLFGYSTTELDD